MRCCGRQTRTRPSEALTTAGWPSLEMVVWRKIIRRIPLTRAGCYGISRIVKSKTEATMNPKTDGTSRCGEATYPGPSALLTIGSSRGRSGLRRPLPLFCQPMSAARPQGERLTTLSLRPNSPRCSTCGGAAGGARCSDFVPNRAGAACAPKVPGASSPAGRVPPGPCFSMRITCT